MSSFANFDKKVAAAEETKPKQKPPKAKAEPKLRETTPAPRGREKTPDPHAAASVLPSPNPKQHAKGRGKGKQGRDKTRSPSAGKKDLSKIPCMFHFEKKGCRKGSECQYSHSQSVYDASKKRKSSRSKSLGKGGKGSRGRSGTPAPGSRKGTCYLFQSGYCPHGNKCMFQHAKHSPPATSKSPQKATPVVVDDFFLSDNEENWGCVSAPAGSGKPRRVRFTKSRPEIKRYVCPDLVDGMPVSQTQRGKGPSQKKVTVEDLHEVGYKRQVSLNNVIARAKGMLMDVSDQLKKLREVRIMFFSTSDDVMFIRITRDHDSDGIAFRETTERVKSSKCSHCDPDVVCLTVPILERDRRFILDSGSGHDLISQRKIDRMELQTFACDEICFHTANGTTSTKTQATIDMGTFTKKPRAYVLQDTPSVMSLGKRAAWMKVTISSGRLDVFHISSLPMGARFVSSFEITSHTSVSDPLNDSISMILKRGKSCTCWLCHNVGLSPRVIRRFSISPKTVVMSQRN